jgi:hypothetical protein
MVDGWGGVSWTTRLVDSRSGLLNMAAKKRLRRLKYAVLDNS